LDALTLDWLRGIAYVLLLASAIPAGMVIPQLVKARRAPYYIMRRDALRRARRLVLAALGLQALGLVLLIVVLRLVAVAFSPVPVPTVSPTATPTLTLTLSPTCTPSATSTRRPTATPPFIPTLTPAIPLPESALSPPPSAVPAGEDARIVIVTLAAGQDDSSQPVGPGTEFPPGDHRVYLFISYDGLTDGVAWTFAVYHDEKFLDGTTQLWEWGEQGMTYLYYKPPQGYEPGIYEMHLFIEDRLQGVAQFVIAE